MKKRLFKLVASALLLAFAGTGLVGCGGGEAAEDIFYIKNIKLYQIKNTAKEPECVIEDEDLAPHNISLCFNEKIKRVFYVRWMENGDALFYKDIDQPNQEAVLIDSGISSSDYTVNQQGNIITYEKDENVYQSNLENSEWICDPVIRSPYGDVLNNEKLRISNETGEIVYADDADNLYVKYPEEPAELIENEIEEFLSSDDLSTICYLKDGILYQKTERNEPIVISDNVDHILKVYNSGEVYYLKIDIQLKKLGEYVEADTQDVSYSKYSRSLSHDLQMASDWEREERTYTFCYYDTVEGKELTTSTMVRHPAEYPDPEDIFYYAFADDTPAMLFRFYSAKIDKIKFSDYINWAENKLITTGSLDIASLLEEKVEQTAGVYLAMGDQVTKIDYDLKQDAVRDRCKFIIDSEGKQAYFMDDFSSDKFGIGNLYKITLDGKTATDVTLYDDTVEYGSVNFVTGNKLAYYKNTFKDLNDYIGDLYIDQKKIDTIKMHQFEINTDSQNVAYLSDWNTLEECGTLKVNINGESKVIAEKVTAFKWKGDNAILFLAKRENGLEQYNIHSYEMYLYKDEKLQKLDEGALQLVF